jgi:hypothetical protein
MGSALPSAAEVNLDKPCHRPLLQPTKLYRFAPKGTLMN